MENVFLVTFENREDAYQAFDEVKQHMDYTLNYVVAHMVLVEKHDGKITPCEGYDAKCHCPITSTALGGLAGIVIGALAGPVGVILGGAAGSFITGKKISHKMEKAVAEIEQVGKGIPEGAHALIAVVQETQEGEFEKEFYKFKTTINKKDAAQVSVDTEYAMELQKKMDKWDKEHEMQEEVESRRTEFKNEFKNIREAMKIVHDEMEAAVK